jgi:alpha-glucosidase
MELGGQHFDFDARLSSNSEQIPFACALYVREGAVLPTVELEQFVGQRNQAGKPANPITLNIYPARRTVMPAAYDLYEDDGVSRSSAYVPTSADGDPTAVGGDPAAKAEFRQTRITQRWVATDTRQVSLVRLNDGYTPAIDFIFIAVLHDLEEVDNAASATPLTRVVRSGRNVTELTGADDADTLAAQLWDTDFDSLYFNNRINITFIKIARLSVQEELILTYSRPRI